MDKEITIIDRFGRKRRARKGEILGDGERILFTPISLMDAQAHAVFDVLDADRGIHNADGLLAGHRPGYCLNNMRQEADAADVVYEQRRQRLQSAWRNREQHEQQDYEDEKVIALTLDQARAHAEAAYQDKCSRISNQWRTR